jgi:transcriptional regulator with XRE-family HTH domain
MSRNLLAEWMERHEQRQVDFAARVGVSQEQISRYVNGKSSPGRRAALAIERETSGEVPASSWDALEDDAA